MPDNTAIATVSFSTFGSMLRYLRRRACLQQRDLAIAVGYSESQICRLEQNQRLPDLSTLAARFVPALGLEGEEALAARFLALAAEARGEQPPATAARDHSAVSSAARRDSDGNLPAPLTALINRSKEIAAVRAYLERPDVRLLTLVGPPGIGKTRLSLQVAAELHGQFPDGIFFVALAPLPDPALVVPAISRTLGVKARAGQPVVEAVRAAVRERRLLVVLDNVEHVLAAAPEVAELLRLAPHLKILATSRAPLRLSGEHLFVVPALELPDPRNLPPVDEIARYAAVQLFVDRVRAVQPAFTLTDENAAAVVEICARLDALPLAIELAAARSRLFSPRALLERLRGATGAGALHFLVDGPRDLLAHQRTLRSTLDWSYDLLNEDERALIALLAAFAGGCTAEAAEAIWNDASVPAGNSASSTSARRSALDVLGGLLDKSLLKYEIGADGEPRFTMLETIREYALEKLDSGGLAGAARRRHAAYCLALAQRVERELSGAQQDRWLRRLEAEYANLWAALEWFAATNIEGGLRLAASLRHFWHVRGYLSEGRAWLERLLDGCQSQLASLQPAMVRGLCAAGFLAFHQGDFARAVELSERGLAHSRSLDDRHGVAAALYNLGNVAFLQTEYARAAELFEACIALYRELGERAEVAQVLKSLGLIAKDRGDFARATAFYEESLAIRREIGDRRGAAQVLFSLGVVAYWQGEYARAAELTEQSVAIYRGLGDRMGVAYALDTLGMAAYKQGQRQQAVHALEEGLRIFRELGDQVGIALLLTDLGEVALGRGEHVEARRWYREALSASWKVGDKRRVAFCLEGLAAVAGSGDWAGAAHMYGAAEALREAISSPLPPAERAGYERAVSVARSAANSVAAWEVAWAAGRVLTLEEAVACALEVASAALHK